MRARPVFHSTGAFLIIVLATIYYLQGLGVSRRFVEERIRDRVLKEGKESGTLEVIDGKVEKFLWEGNDVKGER
jgi:hypothetical protein